MSFKLRRRGFNFLLEPHSLIQLIEENNVPQIMLATYRLENIRTCISILQFPDLDQKIFFHVLILIRNIIQHRGLILPKTDILQLYDQLFEIVDSKIEKIDKKNINICSEVLAYIQRCAIEKLSQSPELIKFTTLLDYYSKSQIHQVLVLKIIESLVSIIREPMPHLSSLSLESVFNYYHNFYFEGHFRIVIDCIIENESAVTPIAIESLRSMLVSCFGSPSIEYPQNCMSSEKKFSFLYKEPYFSTFPKKLLSLALSGTYISLDLFASYISSIKYLKPDIQKNLLSMTYSSILQIFNSFPVISDSIFQTAFSILLLRFVQNNESRIFIDEQLIEKVHNFSKTLLQPDKYPALSTIVNFWAILSTIQFNASKSNIKSNSSLINKDINPQILGLHIFQFTSELINFLLENSEITNEWFTVDFDSDLQHLPSLLDIQAFPQFSSFLLFCLCNDGQNQIYEIIVETFSQISNHILSKSDEMLNYVPKINVLIGLISTFFGKIEFLSQQCGCIHNFMIPILDVVFDFISSLNEIFPIIISENNNIAISLEESILIFINSFMPIFSSHMSDVTSILQSKEQIIFDLFVDHLSSSFLSFRTTSDFLIIILKSLINFISNGDAPISKLTRNNVFLKKLQKREIDFNPSGISITSLNKIIPLFYQLPSKSMSYTQFSEYIELHTAQLQIFREKPDLIQDSSLVLISIRGLYGTILGQKNNESSIGLSFHWFFENNFQDLIIQIVKVHSDKFIIIHSIVQLIAILFGWSTTPKIQQPSADGIQAVHFILQLTSTLHSLIIPQKDNNLQLYENEQKESIQWMIVKLLMIPFIHMYANLGIMQMYHDNSLETLINVLFTQLVTIPFEQINQKRNGLSHLMKAFFGIIKYNPQWIFCHKTRFDIASMILLRSLVHFSVSMNDIVTNEIPDSFLKSSLSFFEILLGIIEQHKEFAEAWTSLQYHFIALLQIIFRMKIIKNDETIVKIIGYFVRNQIEGIMGIFGIIRSSFPELHEQITTSIGEFLSVFTPDNTINPDLMAQLKDALRSLRINLFPLDIELGVIPNFASIFTNTSFQK